MTINEDRKNYFSTALGHSGTLTDLEWEWLKSVVAGDDQGSIPDLWREYFRSLGYTGSLSDNWSKLPYPLNRGLGSGVPVIPAMTALTDLSGLVIDFDASDAATITQAAGLVSQWNNKGSYGGNAVATGSNRPTTNSRTMGGLNTLDFNGANHMDMSAEVMQLTAATNCHFFVWDNDLNATAAFLHLGQTALAGNVRCGLQVDVGNVDNRIYQYAGASAITDPNAPESDGPAVTAMRVEPTIGASAAVAYNYINGITRAGANGAPTFSAMGVWRIAGDPDVTSARWNGAISEIVGYNRNLTVDEQALVEGFLAWKWGLTANLSASNEWKTKDPRTTAKTNNIVVWGNSFTQNAWIPGQEWTTLLQTNSGRKVSNQGVGGETSDQICARSVIDKKFYDRIRIIEVGTNGGSTLAKIAEMLAYQPPSKFIIFGTFRSVNEEVGTPAYDAKVALDAQIQAAYPNNYMSPMELAVELQAPGGPYANATFYAKRVIQDALRADTIHWTAPLIAYIDQWVRDFLASKGW